MQSLYADGWRQGSVLRVDLTAKVHDVPAGVLKRAHDLWLIADQDCDLDQTANDERDVLIELRAVRPRDPKFPRGIVSRQVAVDEEHALAALDLTTKITPSRLTEIGRAMAFEPAADRRREVRTWLGYRYDRPAIPPELVEPHRLLARLAKASEPQLTSVRDVFVAYRSREGRGKFAATLIAVVADGHDPTAVRRWLERIRDAMRDGDPLFVADIVAELAADTPLDTPEKAYSLYADRHSLTRGTINDTVPG